MGARDHVGFPDYPYYADTLPLHRALRAVHPKRWLELRELNLELKVGHYENGRLAVWADVVGRTERSLADEARRLLQGRNPKPLGVHHPQLAESWGKLTINPVDRIDLEPHSGLIAVKTWDDSGELAQAVLDQYGAVFEDTGTVAQTGHARAPIWRLRCGS